MKVKILSEPLRIYKKREVVSLPYSNHEKNPIINANMIIISNTVASVSVISIVVVCIICCCDITLRKSPVSLFGNNLW